MLVVGCASSSHSADKSKATSPPNTKVAPKGDIRAEDLEVYKRSIWVSSTEVQRATISALTSYPEGFEILLQYIPVKANENNAVHAAKALLTFTNSPAKEAKVAALRKGVQDGLTSETQEHAPRRQVVRNLTEVLFALNPKTYAEDMISAIRERMTANGRTISFSDEFEQQISAISPLVEKRKLYLLVPPLVDLVEDGFFPDSPRKAYSTLLLISV